MAKLNSTRFELLHKLFNPKNGNALAIRSDKHLLRRNIVSGTWHITAKIRDAVSVDQYLANIKNKGYRNYRRGDVPSYEAIQQMEQNGVARATDGCEGIEPDGRCEHGCMSWVDRMIRPE
jgi:hypothetical protein